MKKAILSLLFVSLIYAVNIFAQSNFRTTSLDTAPQVVNVGYTTINNLNIAYPGTAIVYVKFYDTKLRPYAKVDHPVLTMQIGTDATLSYSLKSFNRVTFRNGCWIRCITSITDTSQTNQQPATKPLVEIGY